MSALSSPDILSTSTSIERLREKAAYNEAYKEANQRRIDLGEKRLRISEEELLLKMAEVTARQDEVKARQDEVEARKSDVRYQNLQRYYSDLRHDLVDARKYKDYDEMTRIKLEMQNVQKMRGSLNDK